MKIYDDLCTYDPRINCACDNCFYGRDRLALQLIDALEALEPVTRLARAYMHIQTQVQGFSDPGLRLTLDQIEQAEKVLKSHE